MVDVGCSYGIGSVVIKYGRSFHDLVRFVQEELPEDYDAAVEAMRAWLNNDPPAIDIRSIGVDSSHPAIQFACDCGALDDGIAHNFEREGAQDVPRECAILRTCNLLISTGAIGYVTDRTLDIVLDQFGAKVNNSPGPFAVFTILRMFDTTPIQACFERHGFEFADVPGVYLPQRCFTTDKERDEVLAILHKRGVDTTGLEDQGKHFANLYIAAPKDQMADLFRSMKAAHSQAA